MILDEGGKCSLLLWKERKHTHDVIVVMAGKREGISIISRLLFGKVTCLKGACHLTFGGFRDDTGRKCSSGGHSLACRRKMLHALRVHLKIRTEETSSV